MKIISIIIVSLLFFQSQLFAQNLNRQIKNDENTQKVVKLLSERKIDKAIKLAEKIDQPWRSTVDYKISNYYLFAKNMDKAILYANKINLFSDKSDAYYEIADYISLNGEKIKALEFYKIALFDPNDKTNKIYHPHFYDFRNMITYSFSSNDFDMVDSYLELISKDFSFIESSFISKLNNEANCQRLVEYNLRTKTISKYYLEIVERFEERYVNFIDLLDFIAANYADSVPNIDDCLLICLTGNKKLNVEGAKYFLKKGAVKNIVVAMLMFDKELSKFLYETPGLVTNDHKIEFLNEYYGNNKSKALSSIANCKFSNKKTIVKLLSEIDSNEIDISWFYATIAKGEMEVFKFFLKTFSEDELQKDKNVYTEVLSSKINDKWKSKFITELNLLNFDYKISVQEYVSLYYYGGYGKENIEKLKYYSPNEQNLIFYYMVMYGKTSFVNWLLKNGNIDLNYRPINSEQAPNIVELALLIRPDIGELILKNADPKFSKFKTDINSSNKDTMQLVMKKRYEIYAWVLGNCSFVEIKKQNKEGYYFLSKIIPNSGMFISNGIYEKDVKTRKTYVQYMKDIDYLFSSYVPSPILNPWDFEYVMNQYKAFLYLYYTDLIKNNNLVQYVNKSINILILMSHQSVSGGIASGNLKNSNVDDVVMKEYIRVLKDNKVDCYLDAPIFNSNF